MKGIGLFDEYYRKKSRRRIAFDATALVLLIGFFDYITGPRLSVSIFYLLPISLAAWFGGKTSGVFSAVASAICWMLADVFSLGDYASPEILIWNPIVRLSVFLVVVYLLLAIKALNETLEESVRQKTARLTAEMAERLRVEQEVIEISNRERQRVAHDLHDGLGQNLTGIAFKAKLLAETLSASRGEEAQAAQEIVQLINAATSQTRHLARGLDPIEVEADGLVSALEKLARDTENIFRIACNFEPSRVSVPLAAAASSHLYRIAQEAVTNAIKHGRAGQIDIRLAVAQPELWLTVTDDGKGLFPESNAESGMGLRIMQHRAHLIGGQLKIESRANGTTRVECYVPNAFDGAPQLPGANNNQPT